MQVGYARVVTLDQNLDLQCNALTKVRCERIFEQKKSGKASTKRPEFEAVLAYLRPTDVLVVWKLDRRGRSFIESHALLADYGPFSAEGQPDGPALRHAALSVLAPVPSSRRFGCQRCKALDC